MPPPLTAEDIFGDGGLLAQALPGYEARPQQVQMAERVAQALSGRHALLCEAGTGTGKTLGYLVPAILSGLRVVISTGTRHLQEQLFQKDLPLLQRVLPVPFTAVRLKGIANYLCLRRYDEALRRDEARRRALPGVSLGAGHDGSGLDPRRLRRLIDFRDETETGDRAELPDLPDDAPEWLEVSATSETRLGARCAHFERCFVTRARRRAAQAELIIVNHHLLCADLSLRAAFGEARLLPPYDALICDEAHGLEDVATEHFGVTVGSGRVLSLLRDVRRTLETGPLALWPAALRQVVLDAEDQCGRATERFFQSLRARLPATEGRVEVTATEIDGEPAARALALDTALEALQGPLATAEDDSVRLLARRAQALRDDLALIVEGAGRPGGRHVYWAELQATAGGLSVVLRASPIEVGGLLRQRLYQDCPSVVLTSATLAPGGRFEFIRARLGLSEPDELRLASPFDYERQALLYLPEDLPEPGEPAFLPAAARRMAELVEISSGRAFLLFTSHHRMARAHELLAPLFQSRYLVLRQGDAPKHLLLQQFTGAIQAGYPGAVLFATASFWEGVDVVGESLELVVMDKLPFSAPDDPVVAARLRKLEEEGYSPFALYQLPQAALLLQQGFGRLIRHRGDRGVVALLDRRAVERRYSQAVLSGLPPRCQRVRGLAEVRAFFQAVRQPQPSRAAVRQLNLL